jgi:hypothetical protein
MDAPRPPESEATPEPQPAPPPEAPEVRSAAPPAAQPAPAKPAPAGAGAPGKAPPKVRRRWPFAVVALLAVLALSYLMFFLRYQPLTATGGTSWVDPTYAARVGAFTSPRGEDFTQYNVRYTDGERLTFMFTLTNTGGLPVTVENVRLDAGCDNCTYPLQHRSTAMLAHGPNENNPTHARDLQPFKLAADDYRNIVITAKFVNCKDLGVGDVVTFSSVWVRLRSGMVAHDTTLPLGYNLAVSRKDACPA